MVSKSRTINNNYSEEIFNRQFDNLSTNNNLSTTNSKDDKFLDNKRNINWGEYYLQTEFNKNIKKGGVSDPFTYDKLYIGENTRLDPTKELVRETDMQERSIVPLDSFRINYGGLDYLNESRSGISTRCYKKSNSNN